MKKIFLQGSLSNERQLKYWDRLIKPLPCLMNPSIHTDLSFGWGVTENMVVKDNFYVSFIFDKSKSIDFKMNLNFLSGHFHDDWCFSAFK